MMYHGIVLARDMLFGVARVFYEAGHEKFYKNDTSAGRLSDDERHVIIDHVWLDEPVDGKTAWNIATGMLRKAHDGHFHDIPEKYRSRSS